jgi:hypothetical protein
MANKMYIHINRMQTILPISESPNPIFF